MDRLKTHEKCFAFTEELLTTVLSPCFVVTIARYLYTLGKKMSLCNISRMKISGLLGTGARRTTTLLTTDRIKAKGQSSYHFRDKSFSELSNKC